MSFLRVVSDNPEPVQPESNSLADMLRNFADELEAGEFGDIERIGMALEYDGGISLHALGGFTDLELMGLFSAAHLTVFAGQVED